MSNDDHAIVKSTEGASYDGIKDRTQDWLKHTFGASEFYLCHHCHQALSLEGYGLVCPQGTPVDSHKQGTYFRQ